MADLKELTEIINKQSTALRALEREVSRVIVGQKELITKVLIALISNGHVLIEGVPGLAKTLLVKTLAEVLDCSFQRIQFTPDLLPADIVGTLIYNPEKGEFVTKKGPVFANVVLADEINRAPAKVQSALLEAMQERQVTIGEETYALPEPFIVLATQNPIEQEGTYPLPEAQVDRFMFKLNVSYPSKEEELLILERMSAWEVPKVEKVLTPAEVITIQKVVREVYIDEKVKRYIVDLVDATRHPEAYRMDSLKGMITYGASPRASIYLTIGAKAVAFVHGRGFVVPEDVKLIAPDVLRHRIILGYEAEAEGLTPETVISRILDEVPVP